MKIDTPIRTCCLAALFPLLAGAQTSIIDDTFADNNRSNAALPQSAAWFGSAPGQLEVVDAGGGNPALQIAGDGNVRQAAAFFEPVALAVGEHLVANFRFTPTSAIPEGANVLRVALVGGAPPQSADTQAAGVMTGYTAWINAKTNGVRFYQREAARAGILTSIRGWTAMAPATNPSRRFAWVTGQTYEVTFMVERMSETKVRLAYSIQGGEVPFAATREEAAAELAPFNALAFALHSSLASGLIDDVRLEWSGKPQAVPVQLGTRTVDTFTQTALGFPVIPMWAAPMPREDMVAAGFPRAEQAEHFMVWEATREEGAFNHHAALIHFDGHFFAMWSNHPQGEDAPGQRVLYATSVDAETWTAPRELFPPPDPVKVRGTPGRSLRPDRWAVVDGKLYAIAYHRGDRIPSHPIVRSVTVAGELGSPFVLRDLPEAWHLPQFMRANPESIHAPPLAAAVLQWYKDTDTVSWWAQGGEGAPRAGIDNSNLIEPFTYRNPDGRLTLMMRSHSTAVSRQRGMAARNNRIYVSYLKDDGEWDTPYPTDIPDSPSRTEALALPDGSILLIGSQIAPRFDTPRMYLPRHTLTASFSRDGYRFTQVIALRHSAPTAYRFEGIEGRTLGYGYPSSILHNGTLYSLYSIGKEDIAITRVPMRGSGE